MIEFSVMELVLLVWAVIATHHYLTYKQRSLRAYGFIQVIFENKEARTKIFNEYDSKVNHE